MIASIITAFLAGIHFVMALDDFFVTKKNWVPNLLTTIIYLSASVLSVEVQPIE